MRNIWDCAQLAIEHSREHEQWYDRMRTLVVERTREICAEVPSDWNADDIENASDELKLLMMDFEAEFDSELKVLKQRAQRVRLEDEDEDESSTSMSGRYRAGKTEDPSEVDGVFRTLIEQLEPAYAR